MIVQAMVVEVAMEEEEANHKVVRKKEKQAMAVTKVAEEAREAEEVKSHLMTLMTQTEPFPEMNGISSKDIGSIYGTRGARRMALQQQAMDKDMAGKLLTCRPGQSRHCSKQHQS